MMLPRCRGDVATLDGYYSLTVGAAYDVATDAFPSSVDVVAMSQHCNSVKTFSP